MDKVLVVIDYTNDFVADEGALTCGKPAQAIKERIKGLISEFVAHEQFVVIANDIHEKADPYHPEAQLFPPHNIKGTWGRELFGGLDTLVSPNNPHIRYLDKTRYSAFAGTELELLLRERKINEVHLVGVCTDICVLHTAIDAYNKGFSLVIHADGVQSFDNAGHKWALGHFRNTLGARVVGGETD